MSETAILATIVTVFAAGGLFTVWMAVDIAIAIYRKIRDYIDMNL